MDTPPRRSPLAHRDFRLLFVGSSISALGDQFTLVALPWLVLKLTGSPAALGLVLATMALPRAAFMLIGGAVVDRLSPRRVLLWARAINALLIGMLTLLVFGGAIRMPVVYALSLGIGLATAFAYPAASALLPRLLSPQQLQPANALMMGMRQLSLFVGPALAGLVIGAGAAPTAAAHAVVDAGGLGTAFAVDSVSFVCSLAALLLMRTRDDTHARAPEGHVLANVLGGLRAIWGDVPLRAFMLYVAGVSVFVGGPLQVGLPVLADTRLDHGAASLGILMTANGGGMLLGGFLSGWASRLARGRLGLMILCNDGLAGLALAALAFDHSTVMGAALLACTGVFAGIAQVAVVSWIQRRVPPAMMGRTMSVLMFAFLGLGPLSAAFAGSLLKLVPLPAMFAAAGLALTAIALACMGNPALRSIGTPLRVPDAA